MSLVEITALDADSRSSSSSLALFVHCSRIPASSPFSSNATPDSIHIQLVDPPTLYEANVASSQKPRALDCSGAEYVAAVESALSALSSSSSSSNQPPRFEFRWSQHKRSLTLLERAGFAMTFCTVEFQVSTDVTPWRELLHHVAMQQREQLKLIEETESHVKQCETLLGRKEALLETALTAKQKVEDELFQGFCAVLNAKKDEIRKLQFEVDKAQELHKYAMQATKKRKVAAPIGKKKVTGAKVKRKMEDEEEDEDMSDDGSNEGHTIASEEDEEDGIAQHRAKNDAIKAYGALPPTSQSNSVQISSVEDLLSRVDDIIKNEEEENEATQREGDSRRGRSIMPEPVATGSQVRAVEPSKPRTRKTTISKIEPTPARKSESEKPLRLVSQVDEAMDLEDEDILDMLS